MGNFWKSFTGRIWNSQDQWSYSYAAGGKLGRRYVAEEEFPAKSVFKELAKNVIRAVICVVVALILASKKVGCF